MNDQVKFIVEKLNRDPFKKNLNFINFDNLQGNNLLQILNDVFAAIDPKQKADIRDEGPEQTAIRMFNLLKVLKYRPQDDNINQFRNGLVTGDKVVIHPILKWCLEKFNELKKRAYLARFLVKIDISPEFLSDPTVGDLNSQYESLMSEFKETHKNYDHLMTTQHTTADLKVEIEKMEEEKEQIIKRLERVKKRVDSVNNSSSMLEVTHGYRMEVEREEKISQQKAELKSDLNGLDTKIDRLEKIVKEQQSSYHDLNAETIVQKMEEENRVNAFLVNEKYPKEIASYKQKLRDCESVSAKALMTQAEINDIKKKIADVNKEVEQLIHKRDSNRDLSDDKLIMFRQQATIVARKKDQCAETLENHRAEHNHLDKQLKEKRKQFGDDGETLKGEDFKRYVIKLRSKGNTYKSKREDIAQLQAEYVTLKRTEEIIKKKYDNIKEHLNLDDGPGDDGKNLKDRTEELMSKKELHSKISSKKAELQPIIKELKQLREEIDDMSGEHETRKIKYDQINAGFESNRSQLEAEVRSLADDYRIFEARFHYFNTQKLISLSLQKRAHDEVKLYTKSNQSDNKSLREILVKKIDEQETQAKTLKDKQKTTANVHVDGKKQMRLWKDLLRQMELKRKQNTGTSAEEMNEAYNSIPDDFGAQVR